MTLKVLLLADEPDNRLWDHLDRRLLEGIDLVVSCGDLPASYLSFLTCFTSAPIVYVHGNHDATYVDHPPEGCICIDDGVFTYHGLRLLGLGGSMRYKPGPFQYTDPEMARRVRRMRRQLRRTHGVDMIISHAPMRGIGDAEDLCHRGFEALKDAVETYHPQYFCHGHVHKEYSFQFKRERQFGDTRVINAWTSHVIEVEVPDPPKKGWRYPKKREIE